MNQDRRGGKFEPKFPALMIGIKWRARDGIYVASTSSRCAGIRGSEGRRRGPGWRQQLSRDITLQSKNATSPRVRAVYLVACFVDGHVGAARGKASSNHINYHVS